VQSNQTHSWEFMLEYPIMAMTDPAIMNSHWEATAKNKRRRELYEVQGNISTRPYYSPSIA